MVNALTETGRQGFLMILDFDGATNMSVEYWISIWSGLIQVTSSTSATLRYVDCTTHGLSTGDLVYIMAILRIQRNGFWKITV